jgi:sugar/nucleoside kinase (ribokinase family)
LPNTDSSPNVCVIGAVAYDVIGTTDADLAAPSTSRNCKLTDIREAFGGCGGNIAYNLAHLGTDCVLVSNVGQNDFDPYARHLTALGVQLDLVEVHDAPCARAMIVTDPAGHQFTAFYPGPTMTLDALGLKLQRQNERLACTVVAPFPAPLMLSALSASRRFHPSAARLWCPGQYADSLTVEEIRAMAPLADWIVGNEHEIACLRSATQIPETTTVITTHGPGAVAIEHLGTRTEHPIQDAGVPRDPTGCGDALIAGLVSDALARRSSTVTASAVQAGITVAQRCLEQRGSQCHF